MKRSEINTTKWDACIDAHPLGLPYAYSWYLDAATNGHWDALVTEEYCQVMPLPWNKKWGIKQVYQPHACQQLGVFGYGETLCNAFKAELDQRFKSYHVSFNAASSVVSSQCYTNYTLDLNQPYESLFAAYRKDRRKTIRKAKERGHVQPISTEDFWAFYHKHDPVKANKGKGDISCFDDVLQAALSRDQAEVIGYFAEGALEAVNAYTKTQKRIVSLLGVVNPKVRNNGGGALVFDHMIEQYAEQPLTFDFEGSMLPAVAYFLEGFHPKEENYYYVEKRHPLLQNLKRLAGKG
ncbi:MAG: GNAT family N-acetyltransferase [Saprospiraceae bacterium]|nr:GNAT family N-acetyltransferase [Saprospiraceae bacterium]